MEEKTGAPDSGRAAWNINGQYSQMISRRLEKAQYYYDINDFVQYFSILSSIYELTTHNLDDKVIEQMDELKTTVKKYEKYFKLCSAKLNEGLSEKVTIEYKKGSWRYTEHIKIFQRNLLKILKNCGFLTNITMRSHLKF